ncbi:vacuole protein [Ephemerocybe angulata]|uniref:Vacuole protein n=1 Tax=Ephemerocybe angulata TaxID=980116 RepID=A0A8H6M5R5_9AGAR|nr:vacuole protein [Tulosesus angulatus]
MELSEMPGPSSYAPVAPLALDPRPHSSQGEGSFIFPLAPPSHSESISNSRDSTPSPLTQSTSSLPPSESSKLESSVPSLASTDDINAENSPNSSVELKDAEASDSRMGTKQLSGLSLLRPSTSSASSTSSRERVTTESDASQTPMATPRPPPRQLASPPFDGGRSRQELPEVPPLPHVHWRDPSNSPIRSAVSHSRIPFADERTPLLSTSPPDSGIPPSFIGSSPDKTNGHAQLLDGIVPWSERLAPTAFLQNAKASVAKLDPLSPTHLQTAIRAIPAVLLGSLLNILDGVSYGMIIFPATGVFSGLGPMGVSMFFVSAIIAQLVYTFGGSGFAGANGSMMIEVVPFFHILANDIADVVGNENPEAVIATTLVAFAFSSLLTGFVFFMLGALKLGVIVGFFPRHILVGCIGGVGVFLMATGFAISMRIPDDDFTLSWETLRLMFLENHNLVLWAIPLGLAVLLRLITHRFHHQLIFPVYFIVIPLVFYVVVLAGRFDFAQLRAEGWLFDVSMAREPWWKFYTYLNFRRVVWGALWNTMPTQFALLFFNMLHPPLNVPALAVSLNMDVNTDKELVAHGYSNLLSGLLGTVPNYLVYVNTLLFYRVGGTTRIASFLLAIATVGLLMVGTGPIAYLPVMVVGALIFVLGIDLVKEALWDTRHRTSRSEYVTIVSIMVCMTMWDFVIGVLFGIVVSCFFFVIQNSRRRSIRSTFTGDTAISAVRRPNFQRAYIREVAKQTTVIRLQGFLFFGTIAYVEEAIRNLIEGPYYQKNPVQFLVLDFAMVAGVDMSSAEAFVRVQRLLASKCVTLVLCGLETDSVIGKALDSVGLFGAERVEVFSSFNDAMEWTENIYLRAWYRSQKHEISTAFAVPVRGGVDDGRTFIGSFVASPRRSRLREAGDRTIATEFSTHQEYSSSPEPLNTIVKAFSSFGPVDPQQFAPLTHYLTRIPLPANYVLWRQGDEPDGLYILESGLLKAYYKFENSAQDFEESMVAGTLAGEMTAIADCPRNCTVVVGHAAVVWKLSKANLHRLQIEQPELARVFLQFTLKAATIDYDILLTAMASRQ